MRRTVSVPASSANLGPGFDTLGLGLEVRDEYSLEVTDQPGLVVQLHGENTEELPRDETHLVVRAIAAGAQMCGAPWLPDLLSQGKGVQIDCHNVIPMSAGMGSSASAIVGGLGLGVAYAKAWDGAPPGLSEADLALVNTRAGVWEGHPDNSSASVYGGLTISWMPSADVVRTARTTLHPEIEPVVLVPRGDRLSTATARSVLAPTLPHLDAVRQAGRATLLIHALTSEPQWLLDGTSDWLHQEQRRAAYPRAMAAVDALRDLGQPAVISGAGPSVLVLARAPMVEDLVTEVRSWGRDWRVRRPGVATSGLRVIEEPALFEDPPQSEATQLFDNPGTVNDIGLA